MSIPPIPLSLDRRANLQRDGSGTPVLASVANLDAAASLWLDESKRPCGSWFAGPDGIAAAHQFGATVNEARRYDFGTVRLPRIGNLTGQVVVHLLLSAGPNEESEVGGITYQVAVGGHIYNLATPDSVEVAVWYDVTVPTDALLDELPPTLQLLAVPDGSGTIPNQLVHSITVTAEADDGAPDWQPLALSSCDADTPYSAYDLKVMSDQIEHVASRYARTLLTHSFADATSSSDPAVQPIAYLYKVRAGPRQTPVAVALWVQTNTLTTPASQVVIKINGSTAGTIDLNSGADVTGQWHTELSITAGSLPVDSDVELQVTSIPGAIDGDTNATVTIRNISIIEYPYSTILNQPDGSEVHALVAYDPAVTPDAMDHPPYPDGTRHDLVPETYLAPEAVKLGDPITGNSFVPLDAFVTRTPDWSDCAVRLYDRISQAVHRSGPLVCDQIGELTTSNSFVVAEPLVRWMHNPTRGCTGLQVRVRLSRSDFNTSGSMQLALRTNPGAANEGPALVVRMSNNQLRQTGGWIDFPPLPLDDSQPLNEIGISGGFVDGNGTGVSGEPDTMKIAALTWQELGTTSQRNRYYSIIETANIAASTSDQPCTVSIPTLPWMVRHVRLYVLASSFSTFAAADVSYRVTHDDGSSSVTRTLKSTGTGYSPNNYYSDDVIGDATPVDSLDAYVGQLAGEDWTLLVNNTGSGTGFVDFAVELLG